MPDLDASLTLLGALCFGIVIGWICYRTLRRNQAASGLSDIATVIGALGGAAITGSGNLEREDSVVTASDCSLAFSVT